MREMSKLPTVQPQMEASTSKKGFECCMMCMQICFDTHGDQGQSEAKEVLAAPSFIKVILDSHLSRFLRVPSTFMEDHGYRIGDMVTLRGPTGYECQAPLVYEKGHGFPGGCASFLAYHSVEPGDYMLFTLIANSNFLIKVYNKAGCEKTNFPAIPSVTNHGGKSQTEGVQEKGRIPPNADFNHNRKHSKNVFHEKRLSGTSNSSVQCKARRKRKYKEYEDTFTRKKGMKRLTRNRVMENASNEDSHEKNSFMEERKNQRSRVLFMVKRTISRFPSSVRANLDNEQGPEDFSEQPGRVSAKDKPDSIKWVDARHSHANVEAPNGREKRDTPKEDFVGSVTNFQRGCIPNCVEFAEGAELNTAPGPRSPVRSEHKNNAYSVTLASDYHDFPGENEQHAASDSARTSKEAQQESMDINTAENNRTTKVRQGLTMDYDLIIVPDLTKGKILQEASKEVLEAADSFKTNYPSTRLFIRRPAVTNTFTSFPASFSRKWFPKSKATVTLTNRAGKQWPVAYNSGNKKSRLTGGWKTFASENSLKEGDVCILELINPGKLELLVQIFRSGDFPHEIASQGGDRGGIKVVEHITPQAMKQRELAGKGRRSQGDIEANQRTNNNGCKVADHMKFSIDSGEFKYYSEDTIMMSKVDTQMFLPTAAQFFAGMKELAVPGAEGKVVGDGSTRKENDHKFSRRKEQLTAALRTSARVRAERALVTKQKSLGNGTRNVLDAAKAMQLKNPHVAVVMRASHVLSGFTVFLPVSLPMPGRTTTLTLLDTAGKSCRATWVVASGGKRLSAGWRRFALDHKLVVGDVCIFEVTNVDNLTLLVHVFRARTDVKCNEPSRDVSRRGKRLSVDQRMQSRSVVAKSGKSGVAFVSQRRSVTRTERERAKQEAEALKSKNPTAVVVLPHSSVYRYFLVSIPMKFARKWLPRRLVKVSLQDNTGQSWTATWAGNAKRTPCLKGWRAFSLNHCLEEGDVCVFELMNPMELKFNVHIFRVLALNIRGSEAYTWQAHYSSTSTNDSPGHSKYHLQVRKSNRTEPANNPQNFQSVKDMVHKVAEAEVLPLRRPKSRLFEVIRAANRKRLLERRSKIGLRDAQPDEAATEAVAGPSSFHRSPEPSTDFLQQEDEPVILKMVKSELIVDSFATNTTFQGSTHEPLCHRNFPSFPVQRESQFSPPLIDTLVGLQPCINTPSRSDILLPLGRGAEFSSMLNILPILGPSVDSSDGDVFGSGKGMVFHGQQLLAGCNRASPRGVFPQIRRDSPFNLKAPKTEILTDANASDRCPLGPQLLNSVMGVFSETTALWQKGITEVGKAEGGSVRGDVEMDAEGSERAGATSEMHLSSFSDVSAGCSCASPRGDIPQIRRDCPFNLKAPKAEDLIEANTIDACPIGPRLLDSIMGVFSETTAPWQKAITEVGKDKGGSGREDIETDAEGSERAGATSEMHVSSFSDVSVKVEPG